MRCLLSFLLVLLVPLAAAARSPDKPSPYSKNNEMPRNSDTAACWKMQAAEVVPLDDAPWFTGCFQWHSRADRQYLPFHQWELALTSAEARSGLRLRISSLGPDLKPLLGREGHWVDLGDLPAAGTRDLSYKLNGAAPTAVRCDLSWTGGQQSYLKTAEQALPQPHVAGEGRALLLTLQPAFDHDAKKKIGTVRVWLRNDGGQPATEVKLTCLLKDSAGKVVHEHVHVPEKGSIEPGYAKEQVITIPKCPPYSNLAIKTSTAQDGQTSLNPGKFTTAKELQVAKFAYAGGLVTAAVRNGQDQPVKGLLLIFQLLDAKGGVLREVPAGVGDLAPGEEREIAVKAPDVVGLSGWGYAYETGMGSPDEGAPAPASGELAEIVVEGLALRIRNIIEQAGGIAAAVEIDNRRDGDLAGLVATLTVEDAGGTRRELLLDVGDLGQGRMWTGEISGPGMVGIATAQLKWKSAKK